MQADMAVDATTGTAIAPRGATIALVGHPNVGKSVLFHRLTGTYVNVSNYPGTTVEVARAAARFDRTAEVLDTPGVLALPSRSDDERAAMRALLEEDLRTLVQVGDAKNLRRTLSLTAMLVELRLPMVLVLNMSDEARARNVRLDTARLGTELGIPVFATVATGGEGTAALAESLARAPVPRTAIVYPSAIEGTLNELGELLQESEVGAPMASRGLALLFLCEDPEVEAFLADRLGAAYAGALAIREAGRHRLSEPLPQAIARVRSRWAETLTGRCARCEPAARPHAALRFGQLAIHPVWGWVILLAVLYVMYELVGVFGADTLVGLIEEDLFGGVINPAVSGWVARWSPAPWLTDLMVGEYGLWTMGMTYALALILPIVTTFFLAFGILEDSGYFARLSVIANRLFSMIGLNGRAVLPMVLGLGCVTMATLTTRILHGRRDRLIATFLMALAIPCSAQLGVVLGMLGGTSFRALLAWTLCVAGVLLLAGWLAARLIPGRRIPLVTELPPMRLPVAANVVKKTLGRLRWYLVEVIPLFLIGTLAMFTLDRVGILPRIISAGEPLVTGWLGLPREASAAFVMGFLRRDFGATGLFAMGAALDPLQMLVGMVTITLFVPCIASVLMIVKEHGLRVAAAMLALIMPTAFLVGGIVRWIGQFFL
jgi:ferrous iron transport protein B